MQVNQTLNNASPLVAGEPPVQDGGGLMPEAMRLQQPAMPVWRGNTSVAPLLARNAANAANIAPPRGLLGRLAVALQKRLDRVEAQSLQRQTALVRPDLASGLPLLRGLSGLSRRLQAVLEQLRARLTQPLVQPPIPRVITASAPASATPILKVQTDAQALADLTAAAQQRLRAQAGNQAAFTELLHQAFGDKFDTAKAETLRQQTLAGDFSWMPKIELVSSQALADRSGQQAAGMALGAYDASSDTVYLSQELLQSDPAQALSTLLEEIGHGIDARINTSDAVGDEGEIFGKLVQGQTISPQELAALRADNDRGVVSINGRSVEVEYGWLKKAVKKIGKAVSKGVKKIGKAVVNGAVNFAKASFKIATGVLTFNTNRISEGFSEAGKAVSTTVKQVGSAVKETVKEVGKAVKELVKSFMQSQFVSIVLMVARCIPIPVVQLVVKIVEVVRAAYMVYQGVKNKSFGMALGGLASVAGGVGKIAGSLGASSATLSTISNVANAASKLSTAYNAVANKDIGAALSLLGGRVSSNPTLAAVGGYVKQGIGIAQAVRKGDTLGALNGALGVVDKLSDDKSALGKKVQTAQQLTKAAETGLSIREAVRNGDTLGALNGALGVVDKLTDDKSALGKKVATAQQLTIGAQVVQALGRGNVEAAESIAQGLVVVQNAKRKVEAMQAAAAAAPAQQPSQTTPVVTQGVPDQAPVEVSDLSPPAPRTVTVQKGQTLESIARATYGENWKAGLAQLKLDNGIKLNQYGSPILREGQSLVVSDLSHKTQDELSDLNRLGNSILAANDRGLQAKANAELEQRAQVAALAKINEATTAAKVSALPVATIGAPGLTLETVTVTGSRIPPTLLNDKNLMKPDARSAYRTDNGYRDLKSGKFTKSPFSDKPDKFKSSMESEYFLCRAKKSGTLIDALPIETGNYTNPHPYAEYQGEAKIVLTGKNSFIPGSLDAVASGSLRTGVRWAQGAAEGSTNVAGATFGAKIEGNLSTGGAAAAEAKLSYKPGGKSGITTDVGLTGNLDVAAFRAQGKAEFPMTLGPLTLNPSVQVEGQAGALGVSGAVGFKTYETKTGGSMYIGAGAAALFGVKAKFGLDWGWKN